MPSQAGYTCNLYSLIKLTVVRMKITYTTNKRSNTITSCSFTQCSQILVLHTHSHTPKTFTSNIDSCWYLLVIFDFSSWGLQTAKNMIQNLNLDLSQTSSLPVAGNCSIMQSFSCMWMNGGCSVLPWVVYSECWLLNREKQWPRAKSVLLSLMWESKLSYPLSHQDMHFERKEKGKKREERSLLRYPKKWLAEFELWNLQSHFCMKDLLSETF